MMKLITVFSAFIVSATLASASIAQEAPATIEVPDHIHGDIVYGAADAPIVLVEYASMTCPHCRDFNQTVLPELLKDLIPSGKVKLIFRNFVLNRSDLAVAIISRCTTDLDLTKKLIDIYFEQQPQWTAAGQPGIAIQSIATASGLDFEKVEACASSREFAGHIIEMTQKGAQDHGIDSVPTVLMNGTKVNFRNYNDLIDQVKAAAEK